MSVLDDYLDLVTSEHRSKPNLIAALTALLQPVVDGINAANSLSPKFDVDISAGAQEDVDGLWIGLSRFLEEAITGVYFSLDDASLGLDQGFLMGPFDPVTGVVALDDTTYRLALYAKIAANTWDGGLLTAQEILAKIFVTNPNTYVFIQDNFDMTMWVGLSGIIPSPLFVGILNEIIMRPAAVGSTLYVTSVNGAPIFGLDVENNYIAGLDHGALVGAGGTVVPVITVAPFFSAVTELPPEGYRRRRVAESIALARQIPNPTAQPFLNTVWETPQAPRRADQSFIWHYPQFNILPQVPFNNYDQPLPRRASRVSESINFGYLQYAAVLAQMSFGRDSGPDPIRRIYRPEPTYYWYTQLLQSSFIGSEDPPNLLPRPRQQPTSPMGSYPNLQQLLGPFIMQEVAASFRILTNPLRQMPTTLQGSYFKLLNPTLPPGSLTLASMPPLSRSRAAPVGFLAQPQIASAPPSLPSFVNAGTRVVYPNTSTATPPWPSSMVVGNTVVVMLTAHNTPSTTNPYFTPPAGWDAVSAQGIGTFPSMAFSCYSHRIDGTEGANPDFALAGGAAQAVAVAYQLNTLAVTNPVDTNFISFGTANPHTDTGFTTSAPNSYILAYDCGFANTNLDTPAGWTLLDTQGDNTIGSCSTLFGQLVPNGGDYTGDISENGASADWMLIEIELLSA